MSLQKTRKNLSLSGISIKVFDLNFLVLGFIYFQSNTNCCSFLRQENEFRSKDRLVLDKIIFFFFFFFFLSKRLLDREYYFWILFLFFSLQKNRDDLQIIFLMKNCKKMNAAAILSMKGLVKMLLKFLFSAKRIKTQ